jgi:hypothetical protein
VRSSGKPVGVDDQRLPIPPPGPQLELRAWVQLATAYLRRYVPGVKASSRGSTVTWRLQQDRAVLEVMGPTWFVTLERAGRPTGAGLSSERHDAFTAENLGATLVGFFDPELSRPGHRSA